MRKMVKNHDYFKNKFITKAIRKHGDIYNYSKVRYINSIEKVEIICYKHGSFWVRPDAHVRKVGCPNCKGGVKYTTSDFIEKSKEVHGLKYDYSRVEYINSTIRVIIICPVHSEFLMRPSNHLNGQGCPSCSGNKKNTTDKFIKIANLVHTQKYDYTNVNYKNNTTKVEIVCKSHGKFLQNPKDHMNGHGCKYCNKSKGEELIENILKSLQIKFEREKTFQECRGKIRMLPFDFWISDFHLAIEWDGIQHFEPIKQFGGTQSLINLQTNDRIKDEFCKKMNIQLFRIKWDNKPDLDNLEKLLILEVAKYKKVIDYNKLNLDESKNRIKPSKFSDNFLKHSQFSKLNFQNFLNQFSYFLQENYQEEIIYNYQIGESYCHFFIPKLGLAIKLLSLWRESEIFVKRDNQLKTYIDFTASGYKIVQIFEDSWIAKPEVIKSRIIHLLGKSKKIWARNCQIKEISDNKIVSNFLNSNHIQGNIGSSIKLGLFYDNELVSLMTFGNLRKNLGQVSRIGHWELLRFCNLGGCNVVGSASKLFKYFLKNWQPKSCISYADKCWSNSISNLYTSIGMKFIHESDPSYFYIVGTERKGRFGYRKNILTSFGYDPQYWQEHTICLVNGIYRIYDCGSIKYEFNIDE